MGGVCHVLECGVSWARSFLLEKRAHTSTAWAHTSGGPSGLPSLPPSFLPRTWMDALNHNGTDVPGLGHRSIPAAPSRAQATWRQGRLAQKHMVAPSGWARLSHFSGQLAQGDGEVATQHCGRGHGESTEPGSGMSRGRQGSFCRCHTCQSALLPTWALGTRNLTYRRIQNQFHS